MIRISALCLIGATILMWGCADNPLMDSPARDVEITVPAVAEALARAAEAEEVRADLVRVFRNSEYVEHKLELDELLRRAPLVRDAIAGRLGVRTDHLERFAAGNAHDVYLPFAQDRATWDGEAVPVVAHAEDVDGVGAMLYSALEAARSGSVTSAITAR